MNRRTYEGPMEWEYQDRGPVDATSPFAQLTENQPPSRSGFSSPSKHKQTPNPFAAGSMSSPSKQQPHHPPHTSIFSPSLQKQYTAPPFRNPAFTTPQKRVNEVMDSEMSGIDDSPAMTDNSELAPDTPEVDNSDELGKMTITPATANRAGLFGKMPRSGKGEVPRGKDIFQRDKVRKRRRTPGDRDVGSVRHRISHDSDDSDSNWEDPAMGRHEGGRRKQPREGWFSSLLGAIQRHPGAPTVLSGWLQLSFNVFIVCIIMYILWAFIAVMKSDLEQANDAARSELLGEISACATNYASNRCSPREHRLPALNDACDMWEACMNQDPTKVKRIQISAKNVASVLNEFVSEIHYKAWGFILSAMMVALLANNIGFSRFRESANFADPGKHAPSFPAPSAAPPMMSPQHDPTQAYIWAPIGHTPRRIRRGLFNSADTDTDASPEMKSIMPPQTPSRRSPSKGERGRSPTKSRSPTKNYW